MYHLALYDWKSQSQEDLKETLLERTDVRIYAFDRNFENYVTDDKFEEELSVFMKKNDIQILFSFDYFPIISRVCEKEEKVYISWIYDSPHLTLYSETIFHKCNFIFTFDKNQMMDLKSKGVEKVFHLPLAVNVKRIDWLRKNYKNKNKYKADISFVGSLYEKNFYEQIGYLPAELKGYLEGICMAQMQFYGFDILSELLTEDKIKELQNYVKLNLDSSFMLTYKELFVENFLKKYVSSLERKSALKKLSDLFQVTLYSASPCHIQKLKHKGIVSYRDEMPIVFEQSKLNLNLTIRSISSGIPLRCLDIMGAGGALISNYQPELADYFIPEEEFICFTCLSELLEKTDFYLRHESKRKVIADRGYKKVASEFTYKNAIDSIFFIMDQYL